MANLAILILLAVGGPIVHCVQHQISKIWESETSISDGKVARVIGGSGSVGLPVLRSSRGLEIPLGSFCPIQPCPPCPKSSHGRNRLYALQEGRSGWSVTCRLFQGEDHTLRMQQLGGERIGGEGWDLEQEADMIDYESEGRARRELKGNDGDFYSQACAVDNPWCAILPQLVTLEDEVEELSGGRRGSGRDEVKSQAEGFIGESLRGDQTDVDGVLKQKIVHTAHRRQSWVPFFVILGVFFVAMVGLAFVIIQVLTRIDKISGSKLTRSHCCSSSSNTLAREPCGCSQKQEGEAKEVLVLVGEEVVQTEPLIEENARKVTEL